MKTQNSPLYRVLLISLLMISLLLPAAAGQASQEGLNFTVSVEPASLTAPGTVTVSARVSNAGTTDLTTPMSLYDPDGKLVTGFSDGGSLMSLPSGENYLWQGQYEVKQKQLDEEKLVYTLRYSTQDAAGNLIEQNLPATAEIKFTGEKVDLRVTRTITPEVVRRGKEVSILYELVNQGNVKLNDITIRENRLISTRTQTVKSLEPGASEKITFTKQNVTGDVSSSALITYRKEGDRKTEQITMEAVAIPLAKPGLQYTLTSDKTQYNIGEAAMLTLTIKNAGNISYSNITVTDPALGDVFTNVQVDAGQTRELQKEVTLNKSTTYAFTLHLEDNTGTKQTEKVPELKLSAYAEGQMLRLNLTLTSNRESITSMPGDITFHLSVTNDSNTPAKNIRIYHGNTSIYTINELAPGQSTVLSRDYSLSQPGKYQFRAVATDSQNNPVEFTSNEMNIGYVAPTPTPEKEVIATPRPAVTHSPIPADYSPSGGQSKNILFILTLTLGGLFALSTVLLGVSAAIRANARAKSNAAFDTFELAGGARDYTAEPDEDRKAVEELVEEAGENAVETAEIEEDLPHKKYLKPTEGTEDKAPLTSDEEGAFRLTREDSQEDPAPAPEGSEPADSEPRSRRAQRHKGPEDQDD